MDLDREFLRLRVARGVGCGQRERVFASGVFGAIEHELRARHAAFARQEPAAGATGRPSSASESEAIAACLPHAWASRW